MGVATFPPSFPPPRESVMHVLTKNEIVCTILHTTVFWPQQNNENEKKSREINVGLFRNNFNPLHIGAQRKKEGRCRFFAHINCVLPVLTNQCKAIFAISHREILPNNGTLQMFPLESHELV